MKNLSILPVRNDQPAVVLANGRVMDREGGRFHVLTEAGVVLAVKKADGCLLEPEINDLVLITHGGRAGGFILSVLMKEGDLSRITLKGQARLEAEEFTLAADRKTAIEAPDIQIEGLRGRLNFLSFALNTGHMSAVIEKAEIVARNAHLLLNRLTERLNNCFRWVENLDQLKAGRISRMVKERFSLKARQALIRADEQVTVDADQIHLG
ncbi:MAG: DUF3540 domain-containing protein [Thermodesulfobacteriota bacterium]